MGKNNYYLLLLFIAISLNVNAQKKEPLLLNLDIQFEATDAVNAMYNFEFDKADKEFRWLKFKYPKHPMPYFLLGFAEWWKMLPYQTDKKDMKKFVKYMDSTITFSEKLFKKDNEDIDALFFLSASYGFLARVYSDQKQWSKATFASKNAVKYLELCELSKELSPEFMFGDGLYYYYAEWVKENYVFLRPILLFFRDGNKKLGMEELEKASKYAFYTRTEAQYWMMYIYGEEEKNIEKALGIAEYLHKTFPNNAYFSRYYAQYTWSKSKFVETEKVCLKLLEGIEQDKVGYEDKSGRYASYYLGYINYYFYKETEVSKDYFLKCIQFAENIKATNSGYYKYSFLYLARIENEKDNVDEAKKYYKKYLKIEKNKKSSKANEAKKYLKSNK